MKAPARLFANIPPADLVVRLAACAAVGVLTSGCASYGLSDTRIDPASPVAGDVNRIVKTNATFPKFSQIPAVPKDVRPAKTFGLAAAETVSVRDRIIAATEPNTWTLQGGDATTAFAGQARAAAGPELTPVDPAVTEAFAKELRRRATPPPPPKR